MSGRIMGLDMGTRRIGVALSDPLRVIASPYRTVERRGEAWRAELQQIIQQEEVGEVVVGLPRHMDGREGEGAADARSAAGWLSEQGLKVHLWDERLTTVSAQRALREMGIKAKNQKGTIDQVAAQMILSGFLDSLPRST